MYIKKTLKNVSRLKSARTSKKIKEKSTTINKIKLWNHVESYAHQNLIQVKCRPIPLVRVNYPQKCRSSDQLCSVFVVLLFILLVSL